MKFILIYIKPEQRLLLLAFAAASRRVTLLGPLPIVHAVHARLVRLSLDQRPRRTGRENERRPIRGGGGEARAMDYEVRAEDFQRVQS